jgi:hypothetical protein
MKYQTMSFPVPRFVIPVSYFVIPAQAGIHVGACGFQPSRE